MKTDTQELHSELLQEARSFWIDPTPSLSEILDGSQLNGDTWSIYIPSALSDHWDRLSVEARIAAYCVAARAFARVQDLLGDD
jgi:hypothetical protein